MKNEIKRDQKAVFYAYLPRCLSGAWCSGQPRDRSRCNKLVKRPASGAQPAIRRVWFDVAVDERNELEATVSTSNPLVDSGAKVRLDPQGRSLIKP